jgi:Domain of unknown function DUF29
MTKTDLKPPPNDLYETDFYAWTRQQARLLRERRWDDVDLENVAEEIETLGRSDKRQIESRLRVLMAHLLKWKYQPGLRSPSWSGTITDERLRIEDMLKESPSLKRYPAKVFLRHYLGARLKASAQTGIAFDLFPEECPFTIEEVLDVDFFPEEPGHIGAKK